MAFENEVKQEKVIFDGEEFAEFLREKIASSREEVLVSSYIFEPDSFGNEIFDLLVRKSKEGVTVSILVDGVGSLRWIREDKKQLPELFKVRIYHPLPWPLSRFQLSELARLDHFFRLLYLANLRNHQKLFVFDGQSALLGSRNIHEEALKWRETTIYIEGYPAQTLKEIFTQVWRHCERKFTTRVYNRAVGLKFKNLPPVFSNHTPLLRRSRNRFVLQKIRSAQKRIWICTPYFFPTYSVLRAIQLKAKAGVDIRILVPKVSDVWISKQIVTWHYRKLLKTGAQVFEYQGELLHSKSIFIDNFALVGSSNLNRRSVGRDLEIDYSVSNTKVLKELEEKFVQDISHSVQVDQYRKMNIFLYLFTSFLIKIFPSWF